jgi:hypothetical protein
MELYEVSLNDVLGVLVIGLFYIILVFATVKGYGLGK